jgi:hypothetical protein
MKEDVKFKSPAPTGQRLSVSQDKDTSISLKSKVLSRISFAGTKGITAKELNDLLHFNDARKAISILRGEHYKIGDCRLTDGRKTYFLIPDTQLSLFNDEKGLSL